MRFHIGAIPQSPGFVPEAPWTPMREPSPGIFQLLALPAALAAGAGVGFLWVSLTPLKGFLLPSPLAMLLYFACLIPIHELIHAALHPRSGLSDDSLLGLWPSRLLFFAHYTGELPRNRLVAILLAPLLGISLAPIVVCGITRSHSNTVAFISVLNAICACGDILGAGMVLFLIPAGAVVRNQGWRTYWRLPTAGVRPAGPP